MMLKSKFKTKREYEEEDTIRHLKRLENAQKKKEEKRKQGFTCTFEDCGQHFESQDDHKDHEKKHKEDCYKAMKCMKPQCKDMKVIVNVNISNSNF